MTFSRQSQGGAQFHPDRLSGKFHPPSYLESCSFVTGTLKSDACHMYHLQMAVRFWACVWVGSRIWAVNHILARRHIFTYCMRCSKRSVRESDRRAWARTARTSFSQLSLLESAVVGPKVTHRIYSVLEWNGQQGCWVRPSSYWQRTWFLGVYPCACGQFVRMDRASDGWEGSWIREAYCNIGISEDSVLQMSFDL